MSVEIIEGDYGFGIRDKINKAIRGKKVKDIKFAVTPIIEGGYGNSYSNGEKYYAMIIYED